MTQKLAEIVKGLQSFGIDTEKLLPETCDHLNQCGYYSRKEVHYDK